MTSIQLQISSRLQSVYGYMQEDAVQTVAANLADIQEQSDKGISADDITAAIVEQDELNSKQFSEET